MKNQETTEMTQQQISNEWVSFAKASFYYDDYPNPEDCEFNQYTPITDAQWETFGKIMYYIKEGTTHELPTGSGCRDYYRAYAHMLTVGRKGTKEMISEIIDSTAHSFSIGYHMIEFIGYSELIFKNN